MYKILLLLLFVLLLISCQKEAIEPMPPADEPPSDTIPLVTDTVPLGPDGPIDPPADTTIHITLTNEQRSVWTSSSRDGSSTKDIYYVLDANGLYQTAAKVDHATPASAEKLLALGNYNVFCITNVDPSGFPYSASMLGSDFSTQPMVLNTLTDVSFGQQSLSIVASQTNYDINVPVNHILAKLSLTIASVPADITTIVLTLTNVSKTFYLDGTFANDGTTLDLNLQKATTANADGTYDWTLPESLIYPCPTGATATALTLVAADSQGHTSTYPTSATTICSTGTRTNLTTTWRTLKDYLSYGYTESPWTTTIQQGSFDM